MHRDPCSIFAGPDPCVKGHGFLPDGGSSEFRRPWDTATTPQTPHPSSRAGVSIVSTNS